MFRVGDRVRALRSAEGQYTRGNIYVVSRAGVESITTELDDAGSRVNGWINGYFELVEAGPPPVPPIEIVTYQIYCTLPNREIPLVYVCYTEDAIEGTKRAILHNLENSVIIGVKKIKVKFPGVAAE